MSATSSPIKAVATKEFARGLNPFHVMYKVPGGDGPYDKAKQVQLLERDPDRAIALFWAAINAGDRVDSALKDMAIVMKQQNRPEQAIEAIKSLRDRCSEESQESLDNVLLDLYKKCERLDDQITLLMYKLNRIHKGMVFNGKRTKTARSQGKKFQVSVQQEATRLLGNLGWVYMQQSNFVAAEAVYRKALSIASDNNKVCNLGICLKNQGRYEEAKAVLKTVNPVGVDRHGHSESHVKTYDRAQELLKEMETSMAPNNEQPSSNPSNMHQLNLDVDLWSRWKSWKSPSFGHHESFFEASSSHQEQSSVLSEGSEGWEHDEATPENANVQGWNPLASEAAPDMLWRADILQQSLKQDPINQRANVEPNQSWPNQIPTSNEPTYMEFELPNSAVSKADCAVSTGFKAKDTGSVDTPSCTKFLQDASQLDVLPNRSRLLQSVERLPLTYERTNEFRVDTMEVVSFPSNISTEKPNVSWSDSGYVTMPWRGHHTNENIFTSQLFPFAERDRFPGSDSQSLSKITTVVERTIDSKCSRRLDFLCVDNVIESIVPDAPPASEAVEINHSAVQQYLPELERMRQRRLRVFQDMTVLGSA